MRDEVADEFHERVLLMQEPAGQFFSGVLRHASLPYGEGRFESEPKGGQEFGEYGRPENL